MTDLTEYSDQELSMVVLNDEELYRAYMRASDEGDLRRVVSGFKYTEDQFEELVNDWRSEER